MSYSVETSENAKNELLKTHYYKTSYEKLKNAFLDFCKENSLEVNTINDNFGEILALGVRINVTATITMQNPRETSIDLFTESEYLFNKLGTTKFLKKLYEYLAKKSDFTGVSLHK